MPRRGNGGSRNTTKQKGLRNRNKSRGSGTYCRLNKRTKADRYDRPYLTGNYRRDEQWQ